MNYNNMQEAWSNAHANLLSSLAPDELASLKNFAKTISVAKREKVFAAGDPANSVYIVVDGCIKLYQLSPGGKEIILWFSFPGEIFGVAEAVSGSQREIFAEANVPSSLLVLSEGDFVKFLGAYPKAAMRAIGILSARIRTLGSSIVDLAADDVETRLIRLLLRFAAGSLPAPCPVQKINDDVCLNVDLTHMDIANLIGASRQTVTTTLADFRRRDLITQVDRHIHIPQPQRLTALLDQGGA